MRYNVNQIVFEQMNKKKKKEILLHFCIEENFYLTRNMEFKCKQIQKQFVRAKVL